MEGGEYEAEIVRRHISLNGKTENENLILVHIVSVNYHKLCISAVAVTTPERLNWTVFTEHLHHAQMGTGIFWRKAASLKVLD